MSWSSGVTEAASFCSTSPMCASTPMRIDWARALPAMAASTSVLIRACSLLPPARSGSLPGMVSSQLRQQRIFKRQRISPELLVEVQEWLFRAGWVLFFTGTTYAVVKTEVIDGWGRISSKRIGEDLVKVGRGEFDFKSLEHLLVGSESSGEAED